MSSTMTDEAIAQATLPQEGQQQQQQEFSEKHTPTAQAASSDKPWLESKKRRRADLKIRWVFLSSAMLGIAAVVAMMVITALDTLKDQHNYCLVFEDNFDQGAIDKSIWSHEIQTGGWGTGEFEWTTDSTNNSFIRNNQLHIVPTLTSDMTGEAAIVNGYTLNLTQDGTCTSANKSDFYCAVASNLSTGTVLPPVQSARLTTKLSGKTIKFGKVEVTARMPTGDWIWPAVWMMPANEVYGPWPQSGEIDIFESKGNPSRSHTDTLSSRMTSTLHWGPIPAFDSYQLTNGHVNLFQNLWNQKMHTFGLEWTPKKLVTWQRTRAYEVFSYAFGTPFWTKGDFPSSLANGTTLQNPWAESNKTNIVDVAPFDQDFYLILSVAVGSTNGYFQTADSPNGMPWIDQSDRPGRDFWAARNQWLPSWPTNVEDRAMVVDSVKVWQQC